MRNCDRWLTTEIEDAQFNFGCWRGICCAICFGLGYWKFGLIFSHLWLFGGLFVLCLVSVCISQKRLVAGGWRLLERRVRRLAPAVDSIFTIRQESTSLFLTDLEGERCYLIVKEATPADAFRLMNLGRRLTTLYRRNLKELEQYPQFQLREDDPLLVEVDQRQCRSLLSPEFRFYLMGVDAAYQRAERKRSRRVRKEAKAAIIAERLRQRQERENAEAAAAVAALALATEAATRPIDIDAPEGALSRLPGSSDDPTQASISPS